MTRSYRGNRNEQLFKNLYGFRGRRLKIKKKKYLVIFQLNSTKLAEEIENNLIAIQPGTININSIKDEKLYHPSIANRE